MSRQAVARMPLPSCEFGIIAGGKGNGKGKNPLLGGDNHGVVTVEETRLPGAADFLLIDAGHTFITANEAAVEATRRFLETGKSGRRTEHAERERLR